MCGGGGGWIQVLDLRDENCFRRARIRGSHNIPVDSLAKDNRWCVSPVLSLNVERESQAKLDSLNRLDMALGDRPRHSREHRGVALR